MTESIAQPPADIQGPQRIYPPHQFVLGSVLICASSANMFGQLVIQVVVQQHEKVEETVQFVAAAAVTGATINQTGGFAAVLPGSHRGKKFIKKIPNAIFRTSLSVLYHWRLLN